MRSFVCTTSYFYAITAMSLKVSKRNQYLAFALKAVRLLVLVLGLDFYQFLLYDYATLKAILWSVLPTLRSAFSPFTSLSSFSSSIRSFNILTVSVTLL